MLALNYIPDVTLVPLNRTELALDTSYNEDFLYFHERGVDFLFILMYIHLLRKLYLSCTNSFYATA
jgi:quinol-cytochrome oxidoreductase complex cytochrome b subunit